ncbi:MAG: DEAD/DEAH box helicase, partial [Verrucomicrobia bacterium]|nr:DEAD/DEAH box helicase [Verrucomicrobiota bacterium]
MSSALAKRSSSPAAETLLAALPQSPAVQDLARRVEKGELSLLTGLAPAAQAFITALLQRCLPDHGVVLVADNRRTQELFDQDVRTWLALLAPSEPTGTSDTLFFPDWEVLPHEPALPHADVISERLEALATLSARPRAPKPIITNVTALLQRTFSPQAIADRQRRLRRGDRIDPLDLVEWLEDQGYEPEAQVDQKGQLSLRGGILDVFPLAHPWPVRLEFFGDDLDSLRYFDPVTQISRERIEEITLTPGGELGLLRQSVQQGIANVTGTLLEHLPDQTLWLLSEPDRLADHAAEYSSKLAPTDPLFIRWETLQETIRRHAQLLVGLIEDDMPDLGPPAAGENTSREPASPQLQSLDAFRPHLKEAPRTEIREIQRREFFQQMHRWMRRGLQVHVVCNNQGERRRFEEVWAEQGVGATGSGSDVHPALHVGALSRGFLWEAAGIVVVTDAEVFGREKIQRPRRLKAAHAQTTRSALEIDFTDLEDGDLVVHLQHGIGRYVGLEASPAGTSRHTRQDGPGPECLVIEYAPSDPAQPPPKLYVPVSEAHLVSKYVGAGKAHPPLNTLGGSRWKKAREQAENAVRDVAADMLAIQAVRESQPGHAFEPDTRWQQEFEDSFVYEETPDQLRAIADTKSDLERARPMDRLICGDVGFGKTEVAIRAAFKAVMGGKQVALLVPTTVLAQQHYNTFSERMADYPVRVELLSRFRSRGQQEQVVRDLALGAIDIVVGTHRLVQPDVVFKDLGLVVVDEEQRFGVAHKERLKRLRTMVDVLTLSATPIPRTLYLAMCGARDMSTIQTPPQDRLPVETIVSSYDERLIRDAI